MVATVASTGCSGDSELGPPQRLAQDSPRLVFNKSIGDIRLRMARGDVERRYGAPERTRAFRDYFPVGTRYEGESLVRALFRVHGGELTVDYVDDEVKTIETTSAHYRTQSGIGVGARVPRDRCTRLDDVGHVGPRDCKNTWRGFAFDGDCLDAWLTSPQARAMTLLQMHRGRRIVSVQVGDPDVILPCF